MTRLNQAALCRLRKRGLVASRFRRSKWRNVKVELDGHKFDSKKEAARYQQLKLLLRARAIKNLRFQVWYRLEVNGVLICRYRADFVYEDAERGETVEDVKGFRTPVYKLKAKLMLACHGIRIRET